VAYTYQNKVFTTYQEIKKKTVSDSENLGLECSYNASVIINQ
jgi:hypothetical protein